MESLPQIRRVNLARVPTPDWIRSQAAAYQARDNEAALWLAAQLRILADDAELIWIDDPIDTDEIAAKRAALAEWRRIFAPAEEQRP